MNSHHRCGLWRTLLDRIIDPIDRRISTRTDAPLLERGYTITDVPSGWPWTRARVYRHPVWDLREQCVECEGSGVLGAHLCGVCAGDGVITLDIAGQTFASLGPGGESDE